jgi:hypothetical protein
VINCGITANCIPGDEKTGLCSDRKFEKDSPILGLRKYKACLSVGNSSKISILGMTSVLHIKLY